MKLTFKKTRGFTLIEITLVIIIMGILAAAIAPALTGMVGRAQTDSERAKLKTLKEALLADALGNGGFVNPLTDCINSYSYTAPGTINQHGMIDMSPPPCASGSPTLNFYGQYLPATVGTQQTLGSNFGAPLTSQFNNQFGENLNSAVPVPPYFDGRPATFLYDVRDGLTRTLHSTVSSDRVLIDPPTASSPTVFCANAMAQMTYNYASNGPFYCERHSEAHNSMVACQNAVSLGSSRDILVPVAMVLVSRGKNRQFEFENMEHYDAHGNFIANAAPGTTDQEQLRHYESPNRGVNFSNDTGSYYDDVVEVITLPEVVAACQKAQLLPPTSCPTGSKSLTVFNGSSSLLYVVVTVPGTGFGTPWTYTKSVNPGSSSIAPFLAGGGATAAPTACFPTLDTVQVCADSGCLSAATITTNPSPAGVNPTMTELDTDLDGIAQVNCTSASACTSN